ncbi:MAG: beta strand repeat-containing protein, partial [Planctomycetota bacterium]
SDNSTIIADSGGVGIGVALGKDKAGAAISVGISAAINEIDNDVRAVIDDSGVTATGNIELNATSTSKIDALTIGGAVAVGSSGKGAGLSFAGAGAGSGNTITNTIEAAVKNSSTVTTTGIGAEVKLTALDNSTIIADSGGFGIAVGASSQGAGASLSVGVSISDNIIENSTKAYIEGSTVTSAGNIVLSALSTSKIDSLTISGAVAVGASGKKAGLSAAGAGASAYNDIKNTIEAYVSKVDSLKSIGGVLTITATDDSSIIADGGGFAIGVGASGKATSASLAIAVSRADNSINNTVRAFIDNSTAVDPGSTSISSAGGILLSAISTAKIDSLTIGGAVAVGASGGGSGVAGAVTGAAAYNDITNTIESYIKGVGSFTITNGDLTLSATDNATITANGVGAAVSVGAGSKGGVALSIGFSISHNTINNTVQSYIDNSALSAPDNTMDLNGGDITLNATSVATIKALSIAASVGVGAGGKGGIALSGGGSESTNKILGKTNAYIVGTDLDNANNVTLEARNTSSITANVITGSLAAGVGGKAGVGASIGASLARNLIGTAANPAEVQAYVRNSNIDATGNLVQTAVANETIDALVVAGSAAVAAAGKIGIGLSGSGADAENTIGTDVKAFIEGNGSEVITVRERERSPFRSGWPLPIMKSGMKSKPI